MDVTVKGFTAARAHDTFVDDRSMQNRLQVYVMTSYYTTLTEALMTISRAITSQRVPYITDPTCY